MKRRGKRGRGRKSEEGKERKGGGRGQGSDGVTKVAIGGHKASLIALTVTVPHAIIRVILDG